MLSPNPREGISCSGKTVLYFGSGMKAPMNSLSNFYHAPLRLQPSDVPDQVAVAFPHLRVWLTPEGTTFPSSEHAWQALKARNEKTFHRFSANGDLGVFAPRFFAAVNPSTEKGRKKAKSSHDYWAKRKMVGILAKMAANPRHANKLNLAADMRNYEPNNATVDLSSEVLEAVWLTILRAKFAAHKDISKTLLDTNNQYLVEFDRGSKRTYGFWAGCRDADTDWLYGGNYMGKALMKLRSELASLKKNSNKK